MKSVQMNVLSPRSQENAFGAELSPHLRNLLVREVQALWEAAMVRGNHLSEEFDAGVAVELATFLAARDDFLGVDHSREVIDRLSDHALEQAASRRMGTHWIGGLTGLSWQLGRLAARDGRWSPDFSEDLDRALLDMLSADEWRGDYDLILGLTGYGLYALEHPNREWGHRLLEQVLRHLDQQARRGGHGLSWYTHPALLPDHQRREFPQGYHNLGLAHGAPGVVGLLALAIEHDMKSETAMEMLELSTDWLLAQQQNPAESGFHFPNHLEAPGLSRPLAWCYGDLGVTCALFRAAFSSGRTDWYRAAVEVGRSCARRRGDAAVIRDAGLCHGSVGAGLIFLRLWQHEGDPLFAEAAWHWLSESLAMRHSEFPETAGIYSMQGGPHDRRPVPSWGLLTGLAGVGMGYLAALGVPDRSWDVALLTNLPVNTASLK